MFYDLQPTSFQNKSFEEENYQKRILNTLVQDIFNTLLLGHNFLVNIYV